MYPTAQKQQPTSSMAGIVLVRMVFVALAMMVLPLSAQNPPISPVIYADSLVPITIVLIDNGSPTGLLRRTGVLPQNVILLDATTVNAQILSDAVFSMLILEAVDAAGRRRSNTEVQRARLNAAHAVYPWADDLVAQLLISTKEPVRGVGRYRSLTIWLPSLRGRQP